MTARLLLHALPADSATTLCSDGTAMPNWLVSFEEVVP